MTTEAYSATDPHAIRPSVSKNRVHFVSCSHERLFVSNQCRRIVANVEYSIGSHRSITLPNRGHDRSANSRRLECGAAWPQSHETI